jgi:hypothetical protein
VLLGSTLQRDLWARSADGVGTSYWRLVERQYEQNSKIGRIKYQYDLQCDIWSTCATAQIDRRRFRYSSFGVPMESS